MAKKFRLTRDVTRWECDWLRQDLLKDTVVYEFKGMTYGCIDDDYGEAISLTGHLDNPFMECPKDALELIE